MRSWWRGSSPGRTGRSSAGCQTGQSPRSVGSARWTTRQSGGIMFEDIPYLLGEIRSRITPESAPPNGMPSGSGTKKPAPASIGAIDDSDDLYAALVEHAQSIAEALEMKGPPLPHRKSERGPLGYP